MKKFQFVLWFAIVLCLLTCNCALFGAQIETGEDYKPYSGQQGKDVVWVPTQQELVDTMLNMAKVTSSDYVVDLGSGDGRTVIAAAKRGATALGIEYNPDMVALSKREAIKEGVSAKATFIEADLFETDFSKATVVTMFLLTDINLKLRPKILDMKPGTRIVSNTFDMGDWRPDQVTTLKEGCVSWCVANFWIVPAKVNGTWKIDNGEIQFDQTYQNITGTMTVSGKSQEFSGKLEGDKISFTVGSVEYTGTVSGNTISGKRTGGASWKAAR